MYAYYVIHMKVLIAYNYMWNVPPGSNITKQQ
jgi:hypothetical protein